MACRSKSEALSREGLTPCKYVFNLSFACPGFAAAKAIATQSETSVLPAESKEPLAFWLEERKARASSISNESSLLPLPPPPDDVSVLLGSSTVGGVEVAASDAVGVDVAVDVAIRTSI